VAAPLVRSAREATVSVSCPACDLPNEASARHCHACGANLPAGEALDAATVDLEERLARARERLADLDWRVAGAGWLALGLLLVALLALAPSVEHPQLGSSLACGRPLALLRGDYTHQYAPTVWAGCESAAAPWRAVTGVAVAAAAAGVVLLAVRGLRIRRAVAGIIALQRDLRAHRGTEEAVTT
jgi:hypothetical protein